MKKWFKYNEVSHNAEWIRQFKTEKDFLAAMNADGQKHVYGTSTPEDRKKQLQEVYAIANGKELTPAES
jgi:hypothetical protein